MDGILEIPPKLEVYVMQMVEPEAVIMADLEDLVEGLHMEKD